MQLHNGTLELATADTSTVKNKNPYDSYGKN
jgi:hypothetical protein